MTITSTGFLLFLTLAALVFHISPGRWRSTLIFPATSLVFLLLVSPSLAAVAVILGFVALFWLLLELARRRTGHAHKFAFVAAVLVVFGWIKGYEFLSFLPMASIVPATIGLSYMLIRALQLLIDCFEEPQIRTDPVTIFSFLTAWPCLVSGPIQRYQDFQDQLASMATFRLTGDLFLRSAERMIKGFFYVCVLADITKYFWLGLKAISFEGSHPLALGVSQGAFLFHLYFDFAGYTEIVIGAGLLFGLQLPENFNSPFHARSFLDFWGRWHMTMSNWFKAYVFNPLLMVLTRMFPRKSLTVVCALLVFFVTFFLVGLWHGTTWAFVSCGVMLGLGATGNHLFRTRLRAALGRNGYDALSLNPAYVALAAAFTFTYICFSVTPLWLTMDELAKMLRIYGMLNLLVAESVLFALMLIVIPWWRHPGTSKARPLWQRYLLLGALCTAIEFYLFLFPSTGGLFFYEQF